MSHTALSSAEVIDQAIGLARHAVDAASKLHPQIMGAINDLSEATGPAFQTTVARMTALQELRRGWSAVIRNALDMISEAIQLGKAELAAAKAAS